MTRAQIDELAAELAALVARIPDADHAFDTGYLLAYDGKGSELIIGLLAGMQIGSHERVVNATQDAIAAGLVPDHPVAQGDIYSLALARIAYRGENWGVATAND